MPKRSAAALATHPANLRPHRLEPSARLPDDEAREWRALVASCAADHFTLADAPLLEQYTTACVTARRAREALDKEGAVVNGRANPWLVVQEKSVRAMVALSARLRVCPQSRFDRLKAGTSARNQGPRGIEALEGLE